RQRRERRAGDPQQTPRERRRARCRRSGASTWTEELRDNVSRRLLARPLRQPTMSQKSVAFPNRSLNTYIGLLHALARGVIHWFAWSFSSTCIVHLRPSRPSRFSRFRRAREAASRTSSLARPAT